MVKNGPILLVEDDTVDAMTVKRALKELKVQNPLDIVTNGEEALEYLKDSVKENPFLILLDLNMPKMNGIELLKIIREEDGLKDIPVVVLTTSQDEKDKVESLDLKAEGYIVKPIDYQEFVEMIKAISANYGLIVEREEEEYV